MRALTFKHPPMAIPWGCLTLEIMGTRKATGRSRRTLYIKNPLADRLAEQVGKRTGLTLSDSVTTAREEKQRKTDRPFERAKVDTLCAGIAALPVADARTPDEILGYDAFGIPG